MTSEVVCPHLWTNHPRGRFLPLPYITLPKRQITPEVSFSTDKSPQRSLSQRQNTPEVAAAEVVAIPVIENVAPQETNNSRQMIIM